MLLELFVALFFNVFKRSPHSEGMLDSPVFFSFMSSLKGRRKVVVFPGGWLIRCGLPQL
jgi:hypothetical protein